MRTTIDKVKRLIWLVDSDRTLAESLGHIFSTNSELEVFNNCDDFFNRKSGDYKIPDLIVLNISIEDERMLKYLRDNSAQLLSICPICVVSELDDYEVMKEVMDVGVSEYLVKPVNINMLKLKSEYLLSGKSLGKILDVQHQSFSLDGKKIPDLTVKQQQILSLFMNSPERVVNRKELLAKIWNDTSVNPKTVDVHLYNLRRKISEHGFLIRSEGGGNWSLMSQKIRV